ncbi:MAG: winged helix-turn-helix transcriptional regulator [Saprospiraceae bacterium]|nr:winged helix-turn-helix transcriptional regulator [Saprospiraceae bacterium]
MPNTDKKYTERQERIAAFANALGHPVRVAILDLLSSQSCCYHGDLSEELPIANSTLSQHLKVLKDAGLIQGEINPPKTKYCINKQNYVLASELFSGFFAQEIKTEFSNKDMVLCSG